VQERKEVAELAQLTGLTEAAVAEWLGLQQEMDRARPRLYPVCRAAGTRVAPGPFNAGHSQPRLAVYQ
jgi:hypothetical protein